MNDANKFYTDVLKDIGVDVLEDGTLHKTLPDGKTRPIKDTKSGVPYALPLKELLRNHIDDYTFFHPLSEHLNRGESRAVQAMRGWVVFHYCELAQSLALELIEAAADQEAQKTMSNKQAAYLKVTGVADDKTVKALTKVIRSTDRSPSRRFLTIYMSNATDPKKNWLRQANLSFPVLDGDDEDPPFDVKGLRKSDIKAIRGIMKYIYGSLWEIAAANEKNIVEIGSSDRIAPYFDSLVQTVIQLSQLFKQKASLHRKHISKELYDKCNVKLDWVELLGNYADYRKMIPAIDNDEADEKVEEAKSESPTWAFQANGSKTPPAPPTPRPLQSPQHPQSRPQVAKSSGGAVSLAEHNAALEAARQQMAAQQHDPYRQAQVGYGGPQQSMHITPQQAAHMIQLQQQTPYGGHPQIGGIGMMGQQQPHIGYNGPQGGLSF